MPLSESLRRALYATESSGNYGAIGPTHPKYGRALGAGQVMEANLPQWSKDALGRVVSPDEFLKNPTLQDAIIDHRMGGYIQKHGVRDALSMWHSGRPLAQAQNAKDSLGTRTPAYVENILKKAGGEGLETAAAPTPVGVGGEGVAPMQAALNPQADMPAPGAQETQGLFGGLQNLFGGGQQQSGEGWNFADALTGAGVAAMARDNPSGAAAMAAALKYSKEKTTSQKSVVSQDKKRGIMNIYDHGTGQVKSIQYAQPEAPDPPDFHRGNTAKEFEKHRVIYENAHNLVEGKLNKHLERLADNQVDSTFLGRLGTGWKNFNADSLTPQQRNALELHADIEKMRNEKLLEQVGVQTDSDAIRMMNEIVPGDTTKYNPKALFTLMDRARRDTLTSMETRGKLMEPYVKKFGEQAVGDLEIYGMEKDNRKKTREQWEGGFGPRRDAFIKRMDEESRRPKDAPVVTGGSPIRQQPAAAPTPTRPSVGGDDFREWLKNRGR